VSETRPALLPLLRSENQLRLLACLLLEPERSYTITELARATGIPQPTVSREVANLASTSVLRVQEIRGRKEVQADTDSVIFPELASLMLKTVGPKTVLERLLADVGGIDAAYVYGSWARRYHGEQGAQPADIDVIVVGAPDVPAVRDRADEASDQLGRDVNISVLTKREWQSKKSGFVQQLHASPLVELDLS
jgi:DNA-binding transcriptional ArsR family regulator